MTTNLLRDVRYAARVLLKSPGVAAVSVLALALGIGANVSCFTTVNALVLHPLPYPGLDRIMTLWETPATARAELGSVAAATFLDWKARSRAFEHLAAYRAWNATLTGTGDPERVQGCLASAELFDLLGLRPSAGRAFAAGETEPGHDAVVVVSQGFWRSRMASAPDAVGRTLRLSDRSYLVVGIMPQDFDFPLATDVWAPLALTGEEKSQRGARDLMVLGRLKPATTVVQARAEMDGIAQRLALEYPKTNQDRAVSTIPLRDRTNNVTDRFCLTLLGAAGFVLLLACANVGNLQLSRAVAHRKMIAVQTALGASRFRIARQLAMEGLILSLAGGGLGLFLASWNMDVNRTVMIPRNILRYVAGIQYMRVDSTVIWFTLAASVAAGMLCGLPATYHVLRPRAAESPIEVLKEGGRGCGMGSSRSNLRNALVVSEVTIALVLLVGAALMVSTFRRMLTVSPGYETRNLLTMEVALPALNYQDDARTNAFYDRALHELAGTRGVQDAGASGYLPAAERVFMEGRPEARPGEPVPAVQAVTARYLQALGLPLEHGRFLSAQDGPDTSRVVVVSESIARYYWPDQQGGGAIGRRIRLAGGTAPWLTVVGVVGDIRDWFTHNPLPRAYLPSAQAPRRAMQIVMRTAVDPTRIVAAVRAAMHAVDANQPVYDLMSMEQAIGEQTSGVRMAAAMMTLYAGIALLLAVTGIYAVVAYSVVQRTHEIGIRMALGAGSADILKMTVGFALRIAAMGLAVGLPLAFLLMQFVSRVLYGVVVVDTLTLGIFSLVLAAAALVAGYLPARQAAGVDPLTALRAD